MNNELIRLSILVAARNEEKIIERLLSSIESLDHDGYELEVLLGNDNSQDGTAAIMHRYSSRHNHWRVFDIDAHSNSALKGKTKVLSFLAAQAIGDILFFTDADILLPRTWLKGMMKAFGDGSTVGVVVGVTRMPDEEIFSKMQTMEWLSVLGIAKFLSTWDIPTTGLGNNMAVTSKAYHAVGGYEKIGFSIVEDYALYTAIIQKGYKFSHLLSQEVEAVTLPPDDFLAQRNRWIQGAFKSQSKFIIPAILQAFSLPFYILMAVLISWNVSLAVWLSLNLTLFIGLYLIERRSGIMTHYQHALLFGIYAPISWMVQVIYFIINRKKVLWKGRKYH